MLDRNVFKKASTYFFLCFVTALVAIFTFAFVKVLKFGFGDSDAKFVNVLQMIFSVVGILVLAIYLSVIKVVKLKTSQFFDCLMMSVLFLLFAIYPCFDLFLSDVANGLLFGLLGFVFGVIAISVFYGFEKNQNGTVRANVGFLIFFVVLFETFAFALFELVLYFILKSADVLILKNVLDSFVLIGYSWIGLAVFVGACVCSLCYGKKFVNLCLCLRN